MEAKDNIKFEQVFNLAIQLSQAEKTKLIVALTQSSNKPTTKNKERELGKYQGKIKIANDFNEPLADFKEYM